jgi:excisionase family DNA binding protein
MMEAMTLYERYLGITNDAIAASNLVLAHAILADKPKIRENTLLTVQEVADQLKVSTKTVYKHCQDGRIPSKKVGRLVRVKPSDCKIDTHRKPAHRREIKALEQCFQY